MSDQAAEKTLTIPIPTVAPIGWEIDDVKLVQEVWDTFVKPDQEAGNVQSGEMRMLMAILRAVAAGFDAMNERLASAGGEPQVIHVHHHDLEAHATSFNEGYEAAVTQGLVDDPALAGDWFEGKLREAQAKALREAAEAAEGMHDPVAPDCREWSDWLKTRAATIEAAQ
jgi:hypothetical protein